MESVKYHKDTEGKLDERSTTSVWVTRNNNHTDSAQNAKTIGRKFFRQKW